VNDLLHILTKENDTLAREVITRQQETLPPNRRMEVVDLTHPNPDYRALLEKIFAAESVQVW
jgi:hypothetical protein